jgi:NADPH2 dehydrogenase
MRMADPIPTYTYLVQQIKARHPDLAYLHLVEPRVDGVEKTLSGGAPPGEQNDFLRKIWSPCPIITTGGYDRKLALDVAEEKGDIIGFGRHFLANARLMFLANADPTKGWRSLFQPDLPVRLADDLSLNPYDRSTFYIPESPIGYIDQPFFNRKAKTFINKL